MISEKIEVWKEWRENPMDRINPAVVFAYDDLERLDIFAELRRRYDSGHEFGGHSLAIQRNMLVEVDAGCCDPSSANKGA